MRPRKNSGGSAGVVLLFLVSGLAAAQPLTFTHLAGTAGAGWADGPASSSSFAFPTGVAVDGSGNVYVADQNNNKIRKITPDGVVTTLAGSGSAGSADGTGTEATFNVPTGVAVDDYTRIVYVADRNNHKIRKVTADGVVTTLAGSGNVGSTDRTGASASFNYPTGVAVDGFGVIYVADTANHTIRRITAGGAVTTLAGSGGPGNADGTAGAASFNSPTGLAADATGNIYVADSGNNRIRVVSPGKVVTTVAGSGALGSTDGGWTTASFANPYGVAVDRFASVYVADRSNHKIRKITPNGMVTTLAGSGSVGSDDGQGGAASFNYPSGLAADSAGNLYVADQWNNDIRKVSGSGMVTTLAGSGRTGNADGVGAAARFSAPAGVAVDTAGNAYVADRNNNAVRRVTATGAVTTLAGSGGVGSADGPGASASFDGPAGVAVDTAGTVYVADQVNNTVRRVSASGAVTTFAGSGDAGSADGAGTAASFNAPAGVAVDGAGNVYVADQNNNRIREIAPDGTVTTLAGSGSQGSGDGPGGQATFNRPAAVAVDGAGNVYVADRAGSTIRKISAGAVTTLAGSGAAGNADGTGAAASFSSPAGVAVDRTGNVYVADSGNNSIRKVTAGGVVTTVGGNGAMGSADGVGAAAAFWSPGGIAVDALGNVYVSDTGNNSIRLGRVLGSATCTPDDSSLCLLGGRFRLTADYADYDGNQGHGKAVYLTSDTGYFWFFSPSNVETVAKMVDFCGNEPGNVSVYAGGLTDLDVTLHVTDTRDGTAKDYHNPLGTGFTLIRDGPFGCPAGAAPGTPAVAAIADRRIVKTVFGPAPGPAQAGGCAVEPTALCLLGGRFQVRAAFRDYGGTAGTGQAVPLTPDTGYFWFFDPRNVEVVAKMVSFCGSGTNNIGIYAGGLTDVEVALTVTDTETGLTRTYTNPLGSPFQLMRDGPFSCP